jgi:hypothetical protein
VILCRHSPYEEDKDGGGDKSQGLQLESVVKCRGRWWRWNPRMVRERHSGCKVNKEKENKTIKIILIVIIKIIIIIIININNN